jgi:hypothetical protein
VRRKRLLLISFIALATGSMVAPWQASANIFVVPSTDGGAMANSILGPGLTISNVNYTGGHNAKSGALTNAAGFFGNGDSIGLGIDTGVLLTTGSILLAPGPNTLPNAGQGNDNPGDADLTALSGEQTYDATALEFDVRSATGKLFVQYVFASDEYNEYVDSEFNDVFGFFINGKNISLIPGTSTPVAINTVNNISTPAYFRDNDSTPAPYDLQYDGLTTVLTAQTTLLGSKPGGVDHFKLVVADASDHVFDSGVFISGLFSVSPSATASVPEPSVLSILGIGGLTLLLRRTRR